MAECLQVALERLPAEATVGEGDEVVLVAVQSLTAGDELEAAKDQVEAVRVLGPSWLGVGSMWSCSSTVGCSTTI